MLPPVEFLDVAMEQDPNILLRSLQCEEKVYVRFINLTNRCVEIVWINFTGKCERYQLLRKAQYIDVNTYKTHPWVALDVATKDRLLIDNKFIFMPIPWKEYARERNPAKIYPVTPIEKRLVIRITLPLYSLRYRTLLEIRNFCKDPEDADALDLPRNLREQLKTTIQHRNRLVTRIIL